MSFFVPMSLGRSFDHMTCQGRDLADLEISMLAAAGPRDGRNGYVRQRETVMTLVVGVQANAQGAW